MRPATPRSESSAPTRHLVLKQRKRDTKVDQRVEQEKAEREKRRQEERAKDEKSPPPPAGN